MRWRFASAALVGVAAAGPAAAQLPGTVAAPTGNLQSPAFRQAGSPLSPYLNLARDNFGTGFGGLNNAAVNYYNFTRPYTTAVSPPLLQAAQAAGQRQTFFPQTTSLSAAFGEQDTTETPGRKVVLPPAGQPAGFNNTFGYFGGPAAARPQGQQQRPGRR